MNRIRSLVRIIGVVGLIVISAACGKGEITVEDLSGTWEMPGEGVYFQLNEEGTYSFATAVTKLEDNPDLLAGQFTLEGTLLTFITPHESPRCSGQNGSYEVELTEEDQLRFVLREDACTGRRLITVDKLERVPTDTPISEPRPVSAPTPTLLPSPLPQETFAGLAAPDPYSLPEAVAPWGLGGVNLPEEDASIASLFEVLPTEVAGLARSERSSMKDLTYEAHFGQVGPREHRATYGDAGRQDCSQLSLQARDISTGDFFPSTWTAEFFISFWSLGADWDVEAVGREEDIYWVQWNTTCSTEPSPEESPVYALSWGAAASPWVFSAQAGTPKGLDALVAGFVAAANRLKQ